MEKIINFRQLAEGAENKKGKSVRKKMIFRSGIVSEASTRDIDVLKRMGVNYIYDFRGQFEVAETPPLQNRSFNTINHDIVPQAAPRSYARLDGMDGDMVRANMTRRYATFFSQTSAYKPVIASILAQRTPAFLFHCSAGKDRTGIFGAILMFALDYDIQAVKSEFLRINQSQVDKLKHDLFKSLGKTGDTSHLDSQFTVLPEYFDAYTQAVLSTHASFDNYLETVADITPKIKEQLQETYLV